MAKDIIGLIKLQLQAGKANPAPPVGPALGQHGVNIMEFCKAFNSKTQDKAGFIIKSVSVHHGPFPAIGYRIETAGCMISFTGDMSGRLRAMPDLAKGSDLMIAHNAIPEDATGVPALLHMKPSYIGKMAAEAGVKKLLLTHLMKRSISRQDETLKLIQESYKGPVEFPKDLDVFQP